MVTLSRSGGRQAPVGRNTSFQRPFGQMAFAIISILCTTIRNRDKDLVKADIDVLSLVAFLHLVHLKFFSFFSGQSTSLYVCVSSGSPLPTSTLSVPLFSHGDR